MKPVSNALLWLVMTVQRRALWIFTALVVLWLAPKFDLLFYSIAGVAKLFNPILAGAPDNAARDRRVSLIGFILGVGCLLLPWRIGKPLGWSIIGWKILDTFKK